MYKRFSPVFEKVSKEVHPEYEIKDTRPSDYLRKYGTGKIDDLPTTSAPEINDDRTVEQMLDEPVETMATETVDVLIEIEKNKDRFEKAVASMELTQKQKQDFDDAVKVLNDPNSSDERKREAYSILEELAAAGKVTNARAK